MKYLKQTKAHQTGIPKEMPFLIRELKLSRHSKRECSKRYSKRGPFLIKSMENLLTLMKTKNTFVIRRL